MNRDYIISINGKPKYEGLDEDEPIELITSGKFYRKNGNYYITYKESELTGLEGITTTLKIEGDRVTLTRNGSSASHMVFERGQKHFGLYETGFGAMTVGVCAQRVMHNMSEEGGDLEVDYSIEIDHALTGENSFHINVRKAPPSPFPN